MQLWPLTTTAAIGLLLALASPGASLKSEKVHLQPLILDQPVPTVTPGCTKTVTIFAQFTFGPTRTIFTKTKTKTITYDCEGCSKVTAVAIGGPGPQLIYTTTVTAKNATTVTARVCAPTPTTVPTPECTIPPKEGHKHPHPH